MQFNPSPVDGSADSKNEEKRRLSKTSRFVCMSFLLDEASNRESDLLFRTTIKFQGSMACYFDHRMMGWAEPQGSSKNQADLRNCQKRLACSR